jgi:flagellar motor switch protein FliG
VLQTLPEELKQNSVLRSVAPKNFVQEPSDELQESLNRQMSSKKSEPSNEVQEILNRQMSSKKCEPSDDARTS